MRDFLLALLIAAVSVSSAFALAETPGQYFVTAGTLNVRLASNETGKVVKKLRRGDKLEVFELSNGWARVSQYYDAAGNGQSAFVAQWVFAEHLEIAPLAVASIQVDVNSPVYQAIRSSDDLDRHQGVFVLVSDKLVESGQCKLSDFHDIGGWWRSAAHKPRSVYYTYCGGATNEHRIFVDTATGRVFR